jgi:hypothetical protein
MQVNTNESVVTGRMMFTLNVIYFDLTANQSNCTEGKRTVKMAIRSRSAYCFGVLLLLRCVYIRARTRTNASEYYRTIQCKRCGRTQTNAFDRFRKCSPQEQYDQGNFPFSLNGIWPVSLCRY